MEASECRLDFRHSIWSTFPSRGGEHGLISQTAAGNRSYNVCNMQSLSFPRMKVNDCRKMKCLC